MPASPSYSALIRTAGFDEVVEGAVSALMAQSHPPESVVFVDSSNDPNVRAQLNTLGRVVPYPDEHFNYSVAINVGIEAVTSPYTLIVSSHVILESPGMIEEGIELTRSYAAPIVHWTYSTDGIRREHLVTKDTFNGRNGLSNSCCLVETRLIAERPFRPEVFSAEDQEWSAWYFREVGGSILRIEHPDLKYRNAHAANIQKTINEEISIAYFTARRELGIDRVAARLMRAGVAGLRGRSNRARMHFAIAVGLLKANFVQPRARSRYF
jgi:hypothetical protein